MWKTIEQWGKRDLRYTHTHTHWTEILVMQQTNQKLEEVTQNALLSTIFLTCQNVYMDFNKTTTNDTLECSS